MSLRHRPVLCAPGATAPETSVRELRQFCLSLFFIGTVLLGGVVECAPAWAQGNAGAPSLQIPPDARSEGMGRYCAVLQTGPYAAWANVGALGFSRGIEAGGSYAQLVPDFADDVHYYFGSGVIGIDLNGLNLAGNANFTRLGYGNSIMSTDASFEPFEDTYGIAGAIGLSRTIGIGVGIKWVHQNYGRFTTGDLVADTRPVFDAGTLVRIPVMSQNKPRLAGRVTGGIAVHNLGPDVKFEAQAARGDPLPRSLSGGLGGELEFGSFETLGEGMAFGNYFKKVPLVAFSAGLGFQKSLLDESLPDSLDVSFLERNQIELGGGAEMTLLGTLAIRYGKIHDESGAIKAATWGAGLSLFSLAGVDYASVPQALGLKRVKKWSAWLRLPLQDLM